MIKAPKKPKASAYPISLRTLGDRLRAKPLDLGLYQKEVAAILEVTVDTVCYWENTLGYTFSLLATKATGVYLHV